MSQWSFISHVTDYLARPRLGNQKAPTQWPSEATATREDEYGDRPLWKMYATRLVSTSSLHLLGLSSE